VKVFGSKTQIEVYRLLLDLVGQAGDVGFGQPGAALGGGVERASRSTQISTFSGAVNEVQREIVA
jgi:hypothetical protein